MCVKKMTKKVALLTFITTCVLLILTSSGHAQRNNSWRTVAPIPTPRVAAAAVQVDGIIYVMGGESRESAIHACTTVEAYDPATDTWTKKADMITPRQGFLACAVDGKIYAMAGDNSRGIAGDATRLVEMYDPQTDTWQPKTPRPFQRTFFAGCAIDGIIYNFGGGALLNEGAFAECYA